MPARRCKWTVEVYDAGANMYVTKNVDKCLTELSGVYFHQGFCGNRPQFATGRQPWSAGQGTWASRNTKQRNAIRYSMERRCWQLGQFPSRRDSLMFWAKGHDLPPTELAKWNTKNSTGRANLQGAGFEFMKRNTRKVEDVVET